ncbi:unnamed protein product [Effrenium voratum]|uniref:Uncharacterized protein n=1 Tax=Effrenium voratum TaxID=2562239 RepID=A0AA36IVM9_9DINO|nr:unnamed protein product [Effrenium voratum]
MRNEDFASSALALDFCDTFEGVYLPSAEGEVDAWRRLGIEQAHVRGCAVLGFCRDIGWGLWADLWTAGLWLYPLEHAMEDAQLSRPSGGLQLLYRCLHPSPLGAWEAVLGAEPAPQVCVALKADPPEAASDWQDLLGPILGFLLDFHSASWRGFVHQRALNGLSAMEIASRLSHLLADTFAVRCVCRRFLASSRRCSGRWRGALHQLLQLPRRLYKPSEASGMDLSRPFTRSMQLLPTDALRYIMALLTDVNVAALEQSCAFLAKIHGQHRRFEISWKQSLHAMRSRMVALSKTRLSWLSCLSLTAEAHFRRHHWAASITAVKVSTKVLGGAGKMFECEESKGLHKAWPHCVRFAHRLLKQVPVSWDREAFANSESRTTENGIPKETVFSGNLVSTPSCLKSRGQLLLFGDMLWRRDGVPLESEAPVAAHEMLAQLEEGEGTYLGRRRGFGSRRCMPGANRCHWAVCAENMGLSAGDHDARTCPACSETRGFSTLCASFVNSFEFQLPEMTKPLVVDIELEAFVLPFLFTSTDFEQRCLPFRVLEEETEISEDTWGEEDMSDGPD